MATNMFAPSGVSSSDFPEVNQIANAAAVMARTKRENQMQPGRLRIQGQSEQINAFTIGQGQRTEGKQAELDAIMARMDEGDPLAMRDLIRHDPKKGKSLLDGMAKERKVSTDRVLEMGTAISRAAIIAGGDPELYPRLRDTLQKRYPEMTDADMPLEYSPNFAKRSVQALNGLQELRNVTGAGLKNVTKDVGVPGQPGARQLASFNPATPSQLTNVGPPKTPALAKGTKGSGGNAGVGDGTRKDIKAADSNAISREAQFAFGGIIDPASGELVILDPKPRRDATRVAARAEKIWATNNRPDGPGLGHREAVLQAMNELGLFPEEETQQAPGTTVRDQRSATGKSVDRTGTQKSNAADPKNIRGFLER